MGRDRTIRPLGLLEQFSSSRHSLGFYHCVANTCIYNLHFKHQKPSLDTLMLQSLRDIILSTPSLCAAIAGEDSKSPELVQPEAMDLSDHVRFVQPQSMKASSHLFWSPSAFNWREQAVDEHLKLVQQNHSQQWPDIRHIPPWILICSEISSTENSAELAVTFAAHYAIADGLSTVLVHTRLQEILNARLASSEPDSSEFDDVVQLDSTIALVPPLEQLVDLKLSWSFFSKTLWNEFVPRSPFSAAPRLPFTGRIVTREPSDTSMRTSTVSADCLQKVLAACRAHQTTLTALVHAIIFRIMADQCPDGAKDGFVAQTSISLRPHMKQLPNANEVMGAFYTARNYNFTPASAAGFLSDISVKDLRQDENLWMLAGDIGRDLHQRLAALPNDDGIGLLPYVSDFNDWWLKKVGKPRDVTWEVSNIGSMPGSQSDDHMAMKGRCEITQSIFTQSANVAGPAFSVNLASVKGGCLGFSVCWQESVMEETWMEAVVDGLRDGLGVIGA